MAYTLLDAAYALHYSKAEFAKNPFRKKKKPGLLRRTGRAARSAAGSVVGKTWAGRGVRAAGALAGAGVIKTVAGMGVNIGTRRGEKIGYKKGYDRATSLAFD